MTTPTKRWLFAFGLVLLALFGTLFNVPAAATRAMPRPQDGTTSAPAKTLALPQPTETSTPTPVPEPTCTPQPPPATDARIDAGPFLAALPVVSYQPTPTRGDLISLHHEVNLGEYDSLVEDGGDLSHSPYAALAGTRGGMRAYIDDGNPIYGLKRFGAPTGAAYRFRHYIDPNGLSMPESAQITLAQFRRASNLIVTRLQYSKGQYRLYVRYIDDNGAWHSMDTASISNAEHYVEVLVEFASGPSARDGRISYWVDDDRVDQDGNLDLYDDKSRPNKVQLGAVWVSTSRIAGRFFVDEFVMRGNGSYIGPATTLPSLPKPTPTLPPVSGARQITVYPAQLKQTVREAGGGNFQHQIQRVTDAVDPVGALNIKILNPRYVRVNMGLDDWEPTNDNSYPRSINWSAFRESIYHTATLKLMKERANQNATFVASIWDVPNWVVSNPGSMYRRRIRPAMYPEVAESIVAWILHAKRNHGITVHYISINEPDIGVFVEMPAEDYGPLIVETGKRLKEHGLSTRWLLADVSILRTCKQYAATIWGHSDVRPYIGPLSCHSYDQRRVSDQVIRDLGAFAQARGREFWIGEAQWRAQLDPDLYPTWENALKLTIAYSRLLKEGRATTMFYWQMLKNGFSNNDGKSPYPSLEMLAQLQREIPAGARIVATSSNTDSLYSVAAKTSSHFALFAINAEDKTLELTLKDLPRGTYYHIASSAAGTLRLVRKIDVTANQTKLIVGPRSVNVLTTQPPSTK